MSGSKGNISANIYFSKTQHIKVIEANIVNEHKNSFKLLKLNSNKKYENIQNRLVHKIL